MPRIPRPAPATLIAFAALFVALGGPTQAAQLARKVTHHHTHSLRGPRGPRGPSGVARPTFASAPIDSTGRGIARCKPGTTVIAGGVSAGPGALVNQSTPLGEGGRPGAVGWFMQVVTASGAPAANSGNVIAVCVPTS